VDKVAIRYVYSRSALEEHRGSTHYVNYRAQLSGLLAKPVAVTELGVLDEA
jgi:hypothetical protein